MRTRWSKNFPHSSPKLTTMKWNACCDVATNLVSSCRNQLSIPSFDFCVKARVDQHLQPSLLYHVLQCSLWMKKIPVRNGRSIFHWKSGIQIYSPAINFTRTEFSNGTSKNLLLDKHSTSKYVLRQCWWIPLTFDISLIWSQVWILSISTPVSPDMDLIWYPLVS